MTQEPAGEGSLHALRRMRRGVEIIASRNLSDPDDVQDTVQETMARAIEAVRAGRVRDNGSLAAFVHGIARHVIADALRRRYREPVGARNPTPILAQHPSPLEQLVSAEQCEAVRRALAQLPAADRRLLRRCFVDGERIVDIAKQSGQPAERVRKRKSRALEKLRAILAATGGGHVSPRSPT